MKLRLFPHRTSPAGAAQKTTPAAGDPVSRLAPVVTATPRVWSLLLPPGFTSDRK